MKTKYFPYTDTALLEFSDQEISETKELSENIYVDIDDHGNLVSMTIEHAKEHNGLPDLSMEEMKRQESEPTISIRLFAI